MKPFPELAGYETAREWLEGYLNGTQSMNTVQLHKIASIVEAAAAVAHADTDEVLTTEGDNLRYFALERLEELLR